MWPMNYSQFARTPTTTKKTHRIFFQLDFDQYLWRKKRDARLFICKINSLLFNMELNFILMKKSSLGRSTIMDLTDPKKWMGSCSRLAFHTVFRVEALFVDGIDDFWQKNYTVRSVMRENLIESPKINQFQRSSFGTINKNIWTTLN